MLNNCKAGNQKKEKSDSINKILVSKEKKISIYIFSIIK